MESKKIYRGFVKKYILFLVITVFITLFVIGITGWQLQQTFADRELSWVSARQIIAGGHLEEDYQRVLETNGWIQILDVNYQVVRSLGDAAPLKLRYRREEIINYLKDPFAHSFYITADYFDPPLKNQYLLLSAIPANIISVNVDPNSSPADFRRPFLRVLIGSGSIFLILVALNVLLYSYFTARKLRDPLGTILNGIREMGQGEKEVEIQLETGDELEEIGVAFNQMSQQLARSRQEKEAMDQTRRQLLTDISHDLRTPLASIQGYVEALVDGLITSKEMKQQYLELIKDKTVKVNHLINDLFQLSKLERPDHQLHLQRGDLAEFLRSWFAHYIPEIEGADHHYQVEIPEERVMAHFDPQYLERALTNIVINGVKYNPPSTTHTLSVKRGDQGIEIIIGDDGVGIEQKLQEQIFDPFIRGGSSRNSQTGGTGLGLAIAREVIKKHGGEIVLQSEMGMGSQFHIFLPHTIQSGEDISKK